MEKTEKNNTFSLYLVECSDGTFYTGQTKNLVKRLKQHNEGNGGRYTRSRRPIKLLYSEEFQTRSEAMKREIQVKKLSRKQKEELIKSI